MAELTTDDGSTPSQAVIDRFDRERAEVRDVVIEAKADSIKRKLGGGIAYEDAVWLAEQGYSVKVSKWRVREGDQATVPMTLDSGYVVMLDKLTGTWEHGPATVLRKTGGRTVVYVEDREGECVADGVATCHFKDQWDRKLGMRIATQRALHALLR